MQSDFTGSTGISISRPNPAMNSDNPQHAFDARVAIESELYENDLEKVDPMGGSYPNPSSIVKHSDLLADE